jgi:hypothetical protein
MLDCTATIELDEVAPWRFQAQRPEMEQCGVNRSQKVVVCEQLIFDTIAVSPGVGKQKINLRQAVCQSPIALFLGSTHSRDASLAR